MATETPPAVTRIGPRPLILHLWMSASCLFGSTVASRHWKNVWPHLKKFGHATLPPEMTKLAEELAGVLADEAAADAFSGAVEARGRDLLNDFLNGVEAYRNHPFARPEPAATVVWESDGARLFDYGARQAADGVGAGRPVLLIPSLINGSSILDLLPGRSYIEALAEAGFRPLLLDWGHPANDALDYDLGDVLAFRLEPAFDAARDRADVDRLPVIGYCMGGTLALALATRRRREVSGLALLATPWDFHASRAAHARAAASAMAFMMPAVEAVRAVPVDLLQAFFAANDPLLALRKFAAFGRLDQDSDAARHFVALEDWLNDGVPLPHRIARECFADWYGENVTARGEWRVGGQPVRPDAIEVPSLVLIPDRDKIVPPASAERLARALPGAERRVVRAGHIGMVAGSRARRHTYLPTIDWLSRLPET